MNRYKCYNITLDNNNSIQDEFYINTEFFDTNDPLARQDNLVAISGALENIVGYSIQSYSYEKIII